MLMRISALIRISSAAHPQAFNAKRPPWHCSGSNTLKTPDFATRRAHTELLCDPPRRGMFSRNECEDPTLRVVRPSRLKIPCGAVAAQPDPKHLHRYGDPATSSIDSPVDRNGIAATRKLFRYVYQPPSGVLIAHTFDPELSNRRGILKTVKLYYLVNLRRPSTGSEWEAKGRETLGSRC
jgi:hypothetical protein